MDKGLFPRAFCKVVPDFISRDPTQAIVMHADGAGTKSSLAYIYWKKTGDISVWKGHWIRGGHVHEFQVSIVIYVYITI